jgi:hypothetical protein
LKEKKGHKNFSILPIRIQNRIRIRIQGFDDQKWEKTNSGSKITIYFATIKDVQATGKASVLERENPALQNMKFINFFLKFCGSCLPSWIRDPDSDTDQLRRLYQDTTRIRIRNTGHKPS